MRSPLYSQAFASPLGVLSPSSSATAIVAGLFAKYGGIWHSEGLSFQEGANPATPSGVGDPVGFQIDRSQGAGYLSEPESVLGFDVASEPEYLRLDSTWTHDGGRQYTRTNVTSFDRLGFNLAAPFKWYLLDLEVSTTAGTQFRIWRRNEADNNNIWIPLSEGRHTYVADTNAVNSGQALWLASGTWEGTVIVHGVREINAPVGAELAIGDFSQYANTAEMLADGWAAHNYQGGDATIAVEGGNLVVTNDAVTGGNAAAYKTFQTTPGRRYIVPVDFVSTTGTSGPSVLIRETINSASIEVINTLGVAGPGAVEFVAETETTTIVLALQGGGAGVTHTWTSASVREIQEAPGVVISDDTFGQFTGLGEDVVPTVDLTDPLWIKSNPIEAGNVILATNLFHKARITLDLDTRYASVEVDCEIIEGNEPWSVYVRGSPSSGAEVVGRDVIKGTGRQTVSIPPHFFNGAPHTLNIEQRNTPTGSSRLKIYSVKCFPILGMHARQIQNDDKRPVASTESGAQTHLFDGTDDELIEVASGQVPTDWTNVTVAMWVKMDELDLSASILSDPSNDPKRVGFASENGTSIAIRSGVSSASTIYINGQIFTGNRDQLRDEFVQGAVMICTGADFTDWDGIVLSNTSFSKQLNGEISQRRLYLSLPDGESLTAAELKAIDAYVRAGISA